MSILLYGCTTWTLTKRMQKKLDGNYTRMLWAILNKSWRQHPTKQQLYGHLSPVTKTIQVWRIRHVGHCRRSRDELISGVLLWTPSHGRAKARRTGIPGKPSQCDVKNIAMTFTVSIFIKIIVIINKPTTSSNNFIALSKVVYFSAYDIILIE